MITVLRKVQNTAIRTPILNISITSSGLRCPFLNLYLLFFIKNSINLKNKNEKPLSKESFAYKNIIYLLLRTDILAR